MRDRSTSCESNRGLSIAQPIAATGRGQKLGGISMANEETILENFVRKEDCFESSFS